MKNLKNMFAAATLMTVLVFGTTFANAGIIIAGLKDDSKAGDTDKGTVTTCTDDPKSETTGIIIARMGIIIAGLSGIIIAGASDNCSVTKNGIIIAG